MPYRTYSVTHQKDAGFTLRLTKSSLRGWALETVAHGLCTITFRHFCWELCCKAADWSDKHEVELLEIPITREDADALAWQNETWTFLDKDQKD